MDTVRRRASLCALSVAALLLFGASSARADPVAFNANAAGVFSSGACPTCSANVSSITSTGGGGSSTITFSAATPELSASLAPGQSANVTLGVLNSTSTLASGAGGPSFTGAAFTLTLTFTDPGAASPNPAVFTAVLTGQIVQGASGAQMQWTSPRTLSFTSSAGVFTLTIEDFTPVNTPIDPNNTRIRAVLTYTGTAVSGEGLGPVPEPATLLLLGTGLAGVAGAVRRRNKWGKRGEPRG